VERHRLLDLKLVNDATRTGNRAMNRKQKGESREKDGPNKRDWVDDVVRSIFFIGVINGEQKKRE